MEKLLEKNRYQLGNGKLHKKGYDWWWHSFTAYNAELDCFKSFFIEYFIMNPGLGTENVIFGQLPENQKKEVKPSYGMIKVGTWGKDKCQIHNFFPIKKLKIHPNKLAIEFGKNTITETEIKGEVVVSQEDVALHPEWMSDAGHMKWDIQLNKVISFDVGYGTSPFFRSLNAFAMYWHIPGMKTEMEGTIEWNGTVYTITKDTCYGYQDKNWGSDYTSPWIWINSNNIKYRNDTHTLPNSSLDIGGGCPVVFGKALKRKILTCFVYEGKRYEYNFSKFWKKSSQTFEFSESKGEAEWKVTCKNENSKLVVQLSCLKADMLFVNYENPMGKKKHNQLFNGGTGQGIMKLYLKNKGKYVLYKEFSIENCGCEYGEYM